MKYIGGLDLSDRITLFTADFRMLGFLSLKLHYPNCVRFRTSVVQLYSPVLPGYSPSKSYIGQSQQCENLDFAATAQKEVVIRGQAGSRCS